jgi:hypothetical protein
LTSEPDLELLSLERRWTGAHLCAERSGGSVNSRDLAGRLAIDPFEIRDECFSVK